METQTCRITMDRQAGLSGNIISRSKTSRNTSKTQVDNQKSQGALERRAYSAMLLLSWRGEDNPWQALKQCVEFLVAHEADLFVENSEGETACDLAVVCGHHEVALVLEVTYPT